MTIQLKKSKINLREKLAELLNFNEIRDSLSGLGLFLGKDRTNNARNISIRGGADIDDLHIAEISAALGGTAVDVFVYDTRKDSDGGAWRERTSDTSWYNEDLNTATRGSRREFPAVAVIVAESDKVTIYDGDDPDLSMWMIFEQGGSTAGTANLIGPTQASLTSVFMLNGIISITENTWSVGLITANFISEGFIHYWETPKNYNGSISQRNDSMGYSAGDNEIIVNPYGNDVAMTVLPNSTIDSETGLPVPTIAVATDGGVSVIKDDGNVVDSSDTVDFNRVGFKENVVYATRGIVNIETWRFDSYEADGFIGEAYHVGSIPASLGGTNVHHSVNGDNLEMGSANGLGRIYENKTNLNEGMIAYTTSSYNTGWMPGDIKLAALSDTKIEKVGEANNPQLVTNGQFNSDVSSWTNIDPSGSPDATITWSNGTAQVFRPTDQLGRFYQTIDTIVGAEYFIQIGNYGGSNGGVFVADSNDANSWNIIANNGGVIKDNNKHYFTATTTSTYIILNSSLENQSVTFDNISVKRSGELITNGTFDDGTVGWDSGARSDVTISYDSGQGQAKVEASGTALLIHQQMSGLQIGKKYIVSARVTPFVGYSGALWQFYLSTTYTNGLGGISIDDQVPTEVSTTFVATAVNQDISFGASSGTISAGEYFLIDNISVRLSEDDRSVNNNGLQVFGEIDKTPVATGTDLVAYSGFSADDYLMQPYNSDLDFGTGDFCVMGWFKNANVNALLCTRLLPQPYNTSGTDRGFLISFGSNGTLSFATYTQGFRPTGRKSIGSQEDMSGIDGWTHFVAVRDGGVMKLYINAIKETGEAENLDNISDDTISIPLSIGCFNELSANRFTGSVALIRISATVPTAEQISKIYRDEKVLFQDGAQATLYGTSDAVTALAYDDSENLLHVGTASGRSVFNGLKRVDNTTTAVSTAISATEGLVIEQ